MSGTPYKYPNRSEENNNDRISGKILDWKTVILPGIQGTTVLGVTETNDGIRSIVGMSDGVSTTNYLQITYYLKFEHLRVREPLFGWYCHEDLNRNKRNRQKTTTVIGECRKTVLRIYYWPFVLQNLMGLRQTVHKNTVRIVTWTETEFISTQWRLCITSPTLIHVCTKTLTTWHFIKLR